MQNKHDATNRVVVLVDMDCFYCQVEEKLNPVLAGKPLAVVQYNQWRGGGIIAVNYPAREKGVTRHMRGNEAKKICPEIELAIVPNVRGKADLTKYRDAGKHVAEVLKQFTSLLERASVDEAYLDITETVEEKIKYMKDKITLDDLKNTFVIGLSTKDFLDNLYEDQNLNMSDLKLAIGGVITENLRAEVYKQTGYRCSAGVAHNKVLAKLACGINKPNKQTILPHSEVQTFYQTLPVSKIRGLGGKFGNTLSEELDIKFMGELEKFTEKELINRFDEKTGMWLYNIARGVDLEPVTTRLVSKSIGCCKKFPGKSALLTSETILHWLGELSIEISERLENDMAENNRKAKQMVVSFVQDIGNKKEVSSSRTTVLNSYDSKKICDDAFEVIKKYCERSDGSFCVKFLGISVGNFEEIKKVNEITSYFKINDKSSKPKSTNQDWFSINENCKTMENRNQNFSFTEEKETLDSTEIAHQNLVSANEYFENTDNFGKNLFSAEESFENAEENSCSVFSVSTEEDENFNSENFQFYDKKFKINHEELESEESSNDSISGEIDKTKTHIQQGPKKDANSFFVRYFQNLQTTNKSPAKRDFNTSKNLEEDEVTELEQISDIPSTSNSEKTAEICPECGKAIPISEITSHADYHFALQIVKSEAELYKPKAVKVVDSKKTKSTLKRKLENDGKTNVLDAFLKNVNVDSINDFNGEICKDCGKNVPENDWESHLDYHVAKKLHLEINSSQNFPKSDGNKKSDTPRKVVRKGKTSDSKGTIKPVTSFFKTL